MKIPFVLATLLAALTASAQSTVTTKQTTETAPPEVQTRTYVDASGNTVTERVTTTVVRDAESKTKTYKAALFISNRAGESLDDKIPVLEDQLSSRLADLGFQLLTREVVVDAMRKFDPATASSDHPADSVEAQLTNQSSALRLAQNLGVDYIVQASLTGYGKTERTVKAYGNELKNNEWTLRVSYKILDASSGGALTGDTVKATRTEQGTASAGVSTTGLVDDLIDETAGKIVAGLRTRIAQDKIAPAKTKAGLVTIKLNVETADLYLPDVRLAPDNTVTIYQGKAAATPLNVNVEIDGVSVGTAPGAIQLRPGFSHLRLTREGFKPWERTINAVEGQTLTVALEMSDAGLARWREQTAFINALKNGAKLTDAQVKVLEGQAKMFEQSGFKIDVKTKEGLTLEHNQSIFGR